MQGISWLIGGVLPYAAVLVCGLGIAGRALRWQFMPKHLRWTFYPAPGDLTAQARFMAAEIFTFRAVLKMNKVLWAGAWMFHVSIGLLVLWLALMLFGVHLAWLCWLGAVLMGVTTVYLIVYRLTNTAALAVSTPVEFFNLGLFLLVVSIAGAMVLLQRPSIDEIRQYLLALLSFQTPTLPNASLFLVLMLAVEILMMYFPFSRMIHMVSKYFAFHAINWEH